MHELRGDDENAGHESGTESDKDAREAQVRLFLFLSFLFGAQCILGLQDPILVAVVNHSRCILKLP